MIRNWLGFKAVAPLDYEISFRQTGGFAGITKAYHATTATMPVEDAGQLKKLIAGCRWQQAASAEAKAGFPDAQIYELTICGGGEARRLNFCDGTIPHDMTPLIEWLSAHAAYEKAH